MGEKRRFITTEVLEEEHKLELSLRPRSLNEYIGQKKVRELLSVLMEAARQREETLDHVLFYGPPGLG
ncbi:MAG: Holliday junction branch migration DNA helicase RuvB, partial [Lachnospiraceae bacterium]|nr:Holliday junction branch migration DNA helicase RuvB [Lachnospiraceae bacterium]